jgi:asparagine synthase (glutamine-hydrolysing)
MIAVAEAIPFIELTQYDVGRLYELKGEIVSRGVKTIAGFEMPVFPKRRFQHGAVSEESLHRRLPYLEADYRKQFLSLYQ